MATMAELKEEAEALGLKVPGNMSKPKLEAKIEAAKELADKYTKEEVSEPKVEEAPQRELTEKEKAKRYGARLRRVRITCHDPQFKKHNGLIRAAGSSLYFVKRFVPFNRITHIEQVIYDFMKETQFQWFEEKINRTTGRKYKVPRSSPAFVIEDLPDLTKEELEELAKDQAARGAIGDD